LRVIMGVLRKGEGWSEPNYESPKQRYLRQMKAEELKRKKEEENAIQEITNDRHRRKFKAWLQQLSPEKRAKIAPVHKITNRDHDTTENGILEKYHRSLIRCEIETELEKGTQKETETINE